MDLRSGNVPGSIGRARGMHPPAYAAADVRLSLFTGFELTHGGLPVPVQAAAQRLLAFLALHERPVQRLRLAGTLWPDCSDDRSLACLRSALWRARRSGPWVVVTSGDQLALDASVAVDVRELVGLARRLFDGSEQDGENWLWRLAQWGDLLPDWDYDWVVAEREHLRQLRFHLLELLCEDMAAARRFGPAVEACLAAVTAEPLRESAHRALIKVFLAEGNVGQAVAQYRTYRRLVRDELGLEPSLQMEDLVRGLVAH